MNESTLPEPEEIYPRLDYRMTTGSGLRQDSDDYLINFYVKIMATYDPLDGKEVEGEAHLGTLRATLIRVSRAGDEDFSLYDLFDHSQEIQDFAGSLFGPGFEEFVAPLAEAFPYAQAHMDLLLIRDLELHPMARGQRVGISALHRFITEWEASCSLIAIDDLANEFDGDGEGDEVAAAKLENHFRGLGFTKVGTIPYLLLCPANRLAPLEELAVENSMTLSESTLDSLC